MRIYELSNDLYTRPCTTAEDSSRPPDHYEDELEVDAYTYNYEDLTQRCTTAKLDSRKNDGTLSLIPDFRSRPYVLHSVDSWDPARYQYGNKSEW